jgi:hypothetical protein
MKNKNVIKKVFTLKGIHFGSKAVTLGLKSNGEYLVFMSNFEDQWGVLRTKDRNEAVEHANKLVNSLLSKGYYLVK